MNACILNCSIGFIDPDLCDHRYFFRKSQDGVTRGFSTCGVARDALTKFLRGYGAIKASEYHYWLQYLPSVIHNPSVTGFLIEHACLSFIVLNGLNINMGISGGMFPQTFPGKYPDYNRTKELVIYCPTNFNFPAIDALIVRLDLTESKKKAWLFPVQVTIAKRHSDSELEFFAHWAEWCDRLSDFETEVHFLWVTNDNCHLSKDLERKVHSSARGETLIHPDYTSHRLPISLVSSDISRRLESARSRASIPLLEDVWPEGYKIGRAHV